MQKKKKKAATGPLRFQLLVMYNMNCNMAK